MTPEQREQILTHNNAMRAKGYDVDCKEGTNGNRVITITNPTTGKRKVLNIDPKQDLELLANYGNVLPQVKKLLHKNLSIKGRHLHFAGRDTVELAEEYGTPLMLLDEQGIRDNCRTYQSAMQEHFPAGSKPAYASKALSFVGLNRILAEENMDLDVASVGEIYTAQKANFPMDKVRFHSNTKTDSDILYALNNRVGYFMVDNMEELTALDMMTWGDGIHRKVFLRITPGVDAHTHKKITTGTIDSKFGFPIAGGVAEKAVEHVLKFCENLELAGYHCHIGSQIFDVTPYEQTVDTMLQFSADMKKKFGYEAPEIVLGGGFGVRYTEEQPQVDYTENIARIGRRVTAVSSELGLNLPKIGLEPGRSIVAANGMTLYTVGSVKEIPGAKNYVITDGGMADNPRYALYQSPYTILHANKADAPKDFVATIAGRACESGDIIQENVELPKPKRGDTLAVCTTGAYNYAMASNYNRLCRPAIVSIDKDGNDKVVVNRETLEDLVRNDVR